MAWLGRMGRGTTGIRGAAILLTIAMMAAAPASAEERKMLVASFENIQVLGDINVEVQTGKAPSARVKGDRRVLDSLKLERIGMTLRVRLQGPLSDAKGTPMSQPVQVLLSTQGIKDMTVSGNGTLKISSVGEPDAVRMLIAGNGAIAVEQLNADKFSANIDGNGRIEIKKGNIRDAKVTLNGAGQFDAPDVKMRTVRLEHIGNAVSRVQALEEANIFNRGTGNITVGGSGSCFIRQAGSAAINCARIGKGSGK
jgi:hypothetical protein